MTSTHFKLISSDDSSSSPTTPVPQRRAANFLDFLRNGSKGDKSSRKTKEKCADTNESEDGASTLEREKRDENLNGGGSKIKMKPKWKTWERSKTKKSGDKQNKISLIFGTMRKTDKSKRHSSSGGNTPNGKEGEYEPFYVLGETERASNRTKKHGKTDTENQFSDVRRIKINPSVFEEDGKGGNSNCSGEKKRNSSPPVVKSTAFCIMKLEELERSIENTIREKFPDAEPFLLKKRSKDEELKGSRSLPTTPSAKKKLYVARETNGKRHSQTNEDVTSNLNAVRTKLSDATPRITRMSDATYESLPSPAMSPVVLRRFGARTRHASISPKIQRAKTAALYNSPSEMSRVEEVNIPVPKTVTKVYNYQQAKSSEQPNSQYAALHYISPLAHSLKSHSKYDNVNDESDEERRTVHVGTTYVRHPGLPRQQPVEDDDSDEAPDPSSMAYNAGVDSENLNPVIVPTFSAVFGSVSPKLRRHLEQKMKETSKVVPVKADTCARNEDVDKGLSPLSGLTYKSPDVKPSVNGKHKPDLGLAADGVEKIRSPESCRKALTRTNGSQGKMSVKDRIKTLNKSLSEGYRPCSAGTTSKAPAVHHMEIPQPQARDGDFGQIRPLSPRMFGVPCGENGFPTYSGPRFGSLSCPASPPSAWRSPHASNIRGSLSPGSPRKHSTDHVVFGSPVALPCRRVSQPTVSPTFIQTQGQPQNPFCFIAPDTKPKYCKQNSVEGKNSSQMNVIPNPDHITGKGKVSPPDNTTELQIKSTKNIVEEPAVLKEEEYNKDYQHNNGTLKIQAKDDSSTMTKTVDTLSYQSPGLDSLFAKEKNLLETNLDDDVSENQEFSVDTQAPRINTSQTAQEDVWDGHTDDDIVLKQPVSKVIFDMISTSKTPPEDFCNQGHVKTAKTILQSSPTPLDNEKCVQAEAIASVTSHTYSHPCLTLEEKTVRSNSYVSISSDVCNSDRSDGFEDKITSMESATSVSRSAGSQTESFSTAEKGVESDDLLIYTQSSPQQWRKGSGVVGETSRKESSTSPNLFRREGSMSPNLIGERREATEFRHKVISFQRTDALMKREEATHASDAPSIVVFKPPPPSPSAMDKLLEEFEEEDEDDDIEERKEIEEAMLKESEIRVFTDKIYKRLSDLLGSQSGETEETEDDVFEEENKEGKESRDGSELSSKLEQTGGNRNASYNDETDDDTSSSEGEETHIIGSMPSKLDESDVSSDDSGDGQTQKGQTDLTSRLLAKTIVTSSASPSSKRIKKILTIRSSSSSITTTTSSSEDEEEEKSLAMASMIMHKKQRDHEHVETQNMSSEAPGGGDVDSRYLVFQEFSGKTKVVDKRRYSSSREYHSDDDVARGQGIPDYYDDRPLWRRQEKPPGQLSIDMAAIRRRERRERWLKKRRRNRTDLLSTGGSSDTGSETCLVKIQQGEHADPTLYTGPMKEMGSGILSSPKYAKPILPFFQKANQSSAVEGRHEVREEVIEAKIASERLQASFHYIRGHPDDDREEFGAGIREGSPTNRQAFVKKHNDDSCDLGSKRDSESGKDRVEFTSDPDLAIPGIEETFNELMSVQHILEGMSDRAATTDDTESEIKYMPLTRENVRSIRDYYKDAYSSASGRRSRMSNTDRTESDLDIYSEPLDDGSSDSNMYADDEEDDDGGIEDSYATADDDFGAAGGSGSDCKRRHHRPQIEDDEEDDDASDFVVSCTFYNSNALPPTADSLEGDTQGGIGVSSTRTELETFVEGASSNPFPTDPSALHSDEEFLAGSSAIEASYKQMESAADAVSSTFQNAREQMIDIQHHLQALRRQMEVFQDDGSTPSAPTSPDNTL